MCCKSCLMRTCVFFCFNALEVHAQVPCGEVWQLGADEVYLYALPMNQCKYSNEPTRAVAKSCFLTYIWFGQRVYKGEEHMSNIQLGCRERLEGQSEQCLRQSQMHPPPIISCNHWGKSTPSRISELEQHSLHWLFQRLESANTVRQVAVNSS